MKLNTFILLLANKAFFPTISLAECLCDLERRAIARRPHFPPYPKFVRNGFRSLNPF
jgi:hypothetical protein